MSVASQTVREAPVVSAPSTLIVLFCRLTGVSIDVEPLTNMILTFAVLVFVPVVLTRCTYPPMVLSVTVHPFSSYTALLPDTELIVQL